MDRAADAYLVQRGLGRTIVAGYPWFTDWGRDTFIAMRGLVLSPVPALPPAVLPVRQHFRNQIVSIGDGGEHRSDVLTLAVGRGDPVAY